MQTNENGSPSELVEAGSDTLSNLRSKSLMGVQIEVTVSVGKTRLPLSELIKLEKESVLQLDSRIEDPVDIYVGDKLVARGELEEVSEEGGHLGVRLTEVADLSGGV
jgi:flagellar motor switch protein FliN/FliY